MLLLSTKSTFNGFTESINAAIVEYFQCWRLGKVNIISVNKLNNYTLDSWNFLEILPEQRSESAFDAPHPCGEAGVDGWGSCT